MEMGHHAEVVSSAARGAVLQQDVRVAFQDPVVDCVEDFVVPPSFVFVPASGKILPAVAV